MGRNLVIKLHIYAGLLTFTQLLVYGIAGLAATAHLPRPRAAQTVRYVPYVVPPSATDREVAEDVYRTLDFPLTRQLANRNVRRTPENDLLLELPNINGVRRVVVLERERRLRIEEASVPGAMFVNDMHTILPRDTEAPRLIHLWGLYNEFAMWCLIAFCVSGVYLWLGAQVRPWWAWMCLGTSAAVFLALWAAFR